MITNQQEETLRYFQAHAKDWQNKANVSGEENINIIQQRNGYVVDVIKERAETRSVLDVGCGTGDLVCEIAEQGVNAYGIDFAQDMIDIALNKAQDKQLEKADFKCCSVFDFDLTKQKFDVISANGFIEYISLPELNEFFDLAYEALVPNGSFVVGSRNRLFNIFSINSFTQQELDGSDVNALLSESIALASGESIENLSKMNIVPLQKVDTKHTNSGIDVTTRFQYTPVQLVHMLNNRGFRAIEIYPIHIHAVAPSFKAKHPQIHVCTSNLLQAYARNCIELVPYSSSFMLHVWKGQ